ncbi:MAG TPA: putative sulfate exporter family transporter, partial [Acidimicrobiales bacterium]|nr:putative sulfate exporter family transporter [Acidimicrobiales bacterium]
MAVLVPGAAAAGGTAFAATVLGGLAPVVGAPVLAIAGGMVFAFIRPPSARLRPGLDFVSRYVLQGSVVILGLGLSLGQVMSTGASSLPVMVGTLIAALVVSRLAGRALGLGSDLKLLIGVGTAICGASAIAATDAVISADEADVGYSIATIFFFNVVAVLFYPFVGHLLGLSQKAFGLWAGTAVNDTSSVVAAASAYGRTAASYGVVVKLTRTLAIVPITLAIAAWRGRGAAGTRAPSLRARAATARKVFPGFIAGFLLAVAANTAGLVPASWHHDLADLATWSITAALASVGLASNVGHVRRAGARPLLLGAILWATVGLTSLAFQAA